MMSANSALSGSVPVPVSGDDAAARPRMRGRIHEVAFPVAACAGLVLIGTAPTVSERVAAIVYTVTSMMLFGVSALYHRGRWRPGTRVVLKRLDHANIYLFIAGTYTPVAEMALHGAARLAVLIIVWSGAAAGVVFRLVWIGAPRWLYTPLYVLLGWVMVVVMPQLLHGAGVAAFVLILAVGLLYSLGGVGYGLRRPDPWPRVFGFHEVFHTLTVAAYVSQYAAISVISYSGLRAAIG